MGQVGGEGGGGCERGGGGAGNNIDYNINSQAPNIYDNGGSASPKFLVDWQEWQAAFGAAKKFKYFMPYGGIKYSDFREFSGDRTNPSSANTGDSGQVASWAGQK